VPYCDGHTVGSVVAQILDFIRPADGAFDAEATLRLSQAFEKACAELHDRGQPIIVREIIARRIIEIAGRGERDPDQLCIAALTSLGLPCQRN
jgi:hypothetical protein